MPALWGSQPALVMTAFRRKAGTPENSAQQLGKFVQLPLFGGKLAATKTAQATVSIPSCNVNTLDGPQKTYTNKNITQKFYAPKQGKLKAGIAGLRGGYCITPATGPARLRAMPTPFLGFL